MATFAEGLAICIVAFCVIAIVHGEDKTYAGRYLIIAPRTIRSSFPYAVSVNIFDVSQPVTIELTILDEKNQTIAHAEGKDFKEGEPKTLSFETLPSSLNRESRYRLNAKGKDANGKVVFEQEQGLGVETKSRSVFIQTDKAIYKPGAKVHFRVLVVQPDLKPYKGKASIKISDPNQNLIKQFLDQEIQGGVLGKEDKLTVQLSEEPPLGDWKISVVVDGQEEVTKFFTVDKYVLPKFEVTLKTPPFLQRDDDVEFTINAKYTYGKGVAGTAKVKLEIPWYYIPDTRTPDSKGQYPEPISPSISKNVDLNNTGETKVHISRAELLEHKLNVSEGYSTITYSLSASVKEKFTGTEREATGSVTAYKIVKNVKIEKQTDNFKPGLDFNITISITTPDGNPVTETGPVFLTVTYISEVEVTTLAPGVSSTTTTTTTTTTAPPPPPPPANGTDGNLTIVPPPPPPLIDVFYPIYYPQRIEVTSQQQLQLGPDGTVRATLYPPLNASTLQLQAHYGTNDSEVIGSEYAEASLSPTHSFVQLLASSPSVHAGDNVAFKIRSTADVKAVTAQVLSKGAIILTKQVKLHDQKADLIFPSTHEMAPKARIIIYAVRPDNKEIVVDAMEFHVDGLFRNNVSIDVDPKRAEPNQTVEFKVKAEPSSYVGLLAVDQSVLLLKSGNDISSGDVESDIEQYSYIGYYPYDFRGRRKREIWCRFCWWSIGGVDAASVFENSGVLALTDAFVYRKPPPPIVDVDEEASAAAPPKPAEREVDEPAGVGAGAGAGAAPDADRDAGKKAQMGSPPHAPPTPTVRQRFPETWLWVDTVAKPDGTVTYKANVPDTITSWVTSAFALSDTAGLGVAPEPAKVEVFRPFFIRVDLPYSVKRGEKLALQVLAFNYLETEQKVTVTLDHGNKSGFDLVQKPGSSKTPKQLNVKTIKVPSSGGSAVTLFPIVPTIVGEIKILVQGLGSTSSDAVELPLLVEAEGYPVYKTSPLVLEFGKDGNKITKSIKLDIPADAVPGSAKAEFTVNGDIMAPILNNIEQLVQMPYGCGEQNMLTFVPDIVITQYLKATQRLTPALEDKAKTYIDAGYQRELTYQRNDASYSAFGKSDDKGSTWLTAFVVRAFKLAKQFTFVDPDKLNASIAFLLTQQKDNGIFEEHGMIHHKAMQGGASSGGVGLTAYVLLALLENGQANQNALSYLEGSLDNIKDDSYLLSIVTYALHLAKSAKKDEALKLLDAKAIEKDGLKHWEYTVKDKENSNEPTWWNPPRPVDVESTSYALLTYVLRGNTANALPIVRWLASKRNVLGGYSSTQDTVVAIQALGAYASSIYTKDTSVTVNVKNADQSASFNVDPTNAIVLQSTILKHLDQPIDVDATGKGIAYVQINYHYNMPKRNDPQPFVCSKSIEQLYYYGVKLNLCCHYGLQGNSNMVVAEVSAPSGFVISEYDLNQQTGVKGLQRVETSKGGTVANVYIDSLGSEPLCFNVTSERTFQVVDQKPALVTVYDYYDPGHRIEFDYSLSKQQTLDELCEGNCWAED